MTLAACAKETRTHTLCQEGMQYFTHPGIGLEECYCCTQPDAATNLIIGSNDFAHWNLYSADPPSICITKDDLQEIYRDKSLEGEEEKQFIAIINTESTDRMTIFAKAKLNDK